MPIEIKQPMFRNLFFTKQVDQQSISDLSRSIIDINASDSDIERMYSVFDVKYIRQPINIYIDSYGGNVYQILGVIGLIEKSETPVHTIVTGIAASCGLILLVSGHRRFGYKYSTMLAHSVSSGTIGKIEDLKQDLEEVERVQRVLDSFLCSKSSIKKNKLKEIRGLKKDWWINAKQSLKLNIIDEII